MQGSSRVQGSPWCCLLPCPGRKARAVLHPKAGFGSRAWEEGIPKEQPALVSPCVALASPRRAGAQQPPGPDNSRLLGGFRRLTSYKMFVHRIYPVARRSQSCWSGEGAGSERLPLSGKAEPLSGPVPAEPRPSRGGHGRARAGSQTFLGDAHLSSGSSQAICISVLTLPFSSV